jgi:hypothetical protein
MSEFGPGEVYGLWLGGQGTFVPAGVFHPDTDASTVLVVRFGSSHYSVIALSAEPGHGRHLHADSGAR